MDQHFKNPALEIIERQERIRKLATPPTFDIQNYTSQFRAAVDVNRILEIENIARKMCMPQAAIDAMNAYTKTISTDGIKKLLESIQKPLTDVSVRLSMLERLDFSYLHSPAIHNINSMATSMSDTMRLLTETLSVYNTPEFTESLFSSAMAIDSALVDSFGHLHDIARHFPDEAEQVLSENSFDMFSEEFNDSDNNDSNNSKFQSIQEKLNTLTFSEKIDYLLRTLNLFLTLLAFIAAGSKLDVSIDYSKHTERVIVGDTIQETSDTNFNFDLSYGEQETPDNGDLITYIESLSQQIDTLTEIVSELEKQETSDDCQCDCCDNS